MVPPVRPGRLDGGQATVELALGLPVVVLGLLLVLQLALVGRDQLLLTHSTREGARAASVDPAPGAARAAALASTSALRPDRLDVEVRRRGSRVEVRARYRSSTDLPIVGALVPDPELHSVLVMRLEQP